MDTTSPSSSGSQVSGKINGLKTARGIAYSLFINGALPLVIYQLLKSYTSASDLFALFASGIPSLVESIVGIIRQRRIDLMAGLVLISIVVSILLILLGGSPKLYLVRESLITGFFGAAFLISLLLPRPFCFYFTRYFATGNDPENVKQFNSFWQYPYFRFTMRLMTTVWGIAFIVEAIIRIYLVFTLTIVQFLIVSPFIFYGVLVGIIVWTTLYGAHSGRRGAEIGRRHREAMEAKKALGDMSEGSAESE